jgi:hypothetical protein
MSKKLLTAKKKNTKDKNVWTYQAKNVRIKK